MWDEDDYDETIRFNHDADEKDITKQMEGILLGHKIVKVEGGWPAAILTLDDGTKLATKGNEGCGGCDFGNYNLTDLNDCDNVITKVKASFDYHERAEHYDIFVFAEDKKIHAVGYAGTDNGYYGTGFTISIKRPETA